MQLRPSGGSWYSEHSGWLQHNVRWWSNDIWSDWQRARTRNNPACDLVASNWREEDINQLLYCTEDIMAAAGLYGEYKLNGANWHMRSWNL